MVSSHESSPLSYNRWCVWQHGWNRTSICLTLTIRPKQLAASAKSSSNCWAFCSVCVCVNKAQSSANGRSRMISDATFDFACSCLTLKTLHSAQNSPWNSKQVPIQSCRVWATILLHWQYRISYRPCCIWYVHEIYDCYVSCYSMADVVGPTSACGLRVHGLHWQRPVSLSTACPLELSINCPASVRML